MLLTDGTFERYTCEFRAAHLVSPLTHSSHGSSLKLCCRRRQQSLKDRSLFRSFSSSIVMHGSGSIVIFAKGWLATHLAPPNTSVSTRPLYFTLGRAITLYIHITTNTYCNRHLHLFICIAGMQQWIPGSPWNSMWRFAIKMYISAPNDVHSIAAVFMKVQVSCIYHWTISCVIIQMHETKNAERGLC